MTFAGLGFGDWVFIDANIFIFYFGPHPAYGAACGQFLARIENQEFRIITSSHVLGEVAHRLMITEATATAGWSPGKVRQRLKQHPAVLQGLTQFRSAVETILQSRIQVLTIPSGLMRDALAVSQQQGLLVNDAVTVALMQANGLTKIASADTDFDRVPGITRYGPA
jgi:predicted nucleic acid-binding protein